METIMRKATFHREYHAKISDVGFTFCEGYIAVSVSGCTERDAFLIKGSLINSPEEFMCHLSAGEFDLDKELHVTESHFI